MTNKHQSGGFAAYQEYIRHLNRTMPELDQIEQFGNGYQDFLQSPLQVGIVIKYEITIVYIYLMKISVVNI
jgi:hypothetical protein